MASKEQQRKNEALPVKTKQFLLDRKNRTTVFSEFVALLAIIGLSSLILQKTLGKSRVKIRNNSGPNVDSGSTGALLDSYE